MLPPSDKAAKGILPMTIIERKRFSFDVPSLWTVSRTRTQEAAPCVKDPCVSCRQAQVLLTFCTLAEVNNRARPRDTGSSRG